MNQLQELFNQGFSVFPLATNSKTPANKQQGFKNATTNLKEFRQLQTSNDNNVGILLRNAGLIVVDVDRHKNGTNGIELMAKISKQGKHLPENTYIEMTPNKGLHYFYSFNYTSSNYPNTIKLFDAVEVKTNDIIVAPSKLDGISYTPVNSWADVKEAPYWLINEINHRINPNSSREYSYKPTVKTWTGKLLDEINQPNFNNGERNMELTRLTGKILSTGCTTQTAYTFLLMANNALADPLPDNEVNTVFKSILKREKRKVGGIVG